MAERAIALTDVVGYSSPFRSSCDRTLIRDALYEIFTLASCSDSRAWFGDRGDGTLIVFPETTALDLVSNRFAVSVKQMLSHYNSRVVPGARISLRTSLDYGEVASDQLGYNGDCMIRAGRMIDSLVFKQGMAASRATVGLITPSELARRFNLEFDNLRTQVKGTSMNVSMRFV